MKGTIAVMTASMLAASTTMALSSTSPSSAGTAVSFSPSFNRDSASTSSMRKSSNGVTTSADKERFAPRFDGLRFIETLVTAHR